MLHKFINESRILPCPSSGFVNGIAISNLPRYFANNSEIAKAEGYKPLDVVKKPDFNKITQYLTVIYEDTDNAIVQRWVVNDVPQMEEPADLVSRVSALENAVEEQSEVTKILLGVK